MFVCAWIVCFVLYTTGIQGLRNSGLMKLQMSTTRALTDYRLTPVLQDYAEGFRNVPDDKLRYTQLLYLADKCPSFANEHRVEENKVQGCLSTVFVHAEMHDNDGTVNYAGDSDSQLTKGLVAMLVKGLSGHTPAEICAVDPAFIQYAGLAKSLTPGRNNGFLNMLRLMQNKARALEANRLGASADAVSSADTVGTAEASDANDSGHDHSVSGSGSGGETADDIMNTPSRPVCTQGARKVHTTTTISTTATSATADASTDKTNTSGVSAGKHPVLSQGKVYQSIHSKLQLLQPTSFTLVDMRRLGISSAERRTLM